MLTSCSCHQETFKFIVRVTPQPKAAACPSWGLGNSPGKPTPPESILPLQALPRNSQISTGRCGFKRMEKEGRKTQIGTDRLTYQKLFSRDKPYRRRKETSVSCPKFLPLVPRFGLFVLPQGAVKPAQVHHGHVVSGAQVDGLPVVGHSSLGSPWRAEQLLNGSLRKILLQIQHRITECLGLEGTSVGHPVQPPCRSRVTQSRLHRTLSRRGWNISREGDSTTSLGSLCQGSITLRGKKFFLMFSWNFLCFNL